MFLKIHRLGLRTILAILAILAMPFLSMGCKLGSTTTTRVTYPVAWTAVEGSYALGSSRTASLCVVTDTSGDAPCWTLNDETLLPAPLRSWAGITGATPEQAAKLLVSQTEVAETVALTWRDEASQIFGLGASAESSLVSQFQDSPRSTFASRSQSSTTSVFTDDPSCGINLRLDIQGKRTYAPKSLQSGPSSEVQILGDLQLQLESMMTLTGNCTQTLTRILTCVAEETNCAQVLDISTTQAEWIQSWFTAPVLALLNDIPDLQVLAYTWTFE